MRRNRARRDFIVLALIFTVALGCKLLRPGEARDGAEEGSKPAVIAKTEITKEILQERLGAIGVKTAPPPHAAASPPRPNPLTLHLKFSTRNNDFLLNREHLDNFGALANMLRQIFRGREENGVFIEGTNEVYKKITLPAYQSDVDDYAAKGIFVEDFEKLVDDLRNEGFDQIELDIIEPHSISVSDVLHRRGGGLAGNSAGVNKVDPASPKRNDIKMISGGVLNGKAVDLPKPAYPPAARAVRAAGAVSVRVTVGENGDVISAQAVSGHPLLRASAEAAARAAKFRPTVLGGKPAKVDGIIVYQITPD